MSGNPCAARLDLGGMEGGNGVASPINAGEHWRRADPPSK